MHGRQSEESSPQRQRHMVPVPVHGTLGDSSCSSSCIDCFVKDGRKISIGDCALFEAGNAPPFIGIIRSLSEAKDRRVKLCVNWLYRPTDVKLGKAVSLEAAPNEVFYSFHRDEIWSDSLLHPCKVAFLGKGVELPAGISSFVCRRVYDTRNRRLWWLTEQDYRNERQEEVDKLLDKTRLEMHTAVQSTGSSKDLNGPASNLKTSSDSAQNISSPSHSKGKKRERADQGTDSVKRERFSRTDTSDAGHGKQECSAKPEEIVKITNKDGGLINTEAVAQLVQLMQLDRSDDSKKGIQLALWRTELAGVLAATEKEDCLSQFVQLRGLRILDDWLQEAHKGKNGDSFSPKESDKVVEDLLLTLLRALDRLPVDLEALKTYNVGKSVNNLKNHKNQEIQKKARNLVDTWKKLVDAKFQKKGVDVEMKSIDARSGSNQSVAVGCKQITAEGVQGQGGRRTVSMEPIKSSTPVTSSSKAASIRCSQPDMLSRSTSIPSTTGKTSNLQHSLTISSKDSHSKHTVSNAMNDFPVTSIKEEKSSSSSQSQNNSQSWSSEPIKGAGSVWKEDARSSTTGSMTGKGSSSGSRHRKSNNGILVSSKAGTQKEGGAGKSIVGSKSACDNKTMQSSHAPDKANDASNYRFIVKLSNPGRASPSVGGTAEDAGATASRGSSPAVSERHDLTEVKPKIKDTPRANVTGEVNTESWQSNEIKDGCIEGDDGDRSSVAIPSEDRSRVAEETDKSEISKLLSLDTGKERGEQLKGVATPEAEKSPEKVSSGMTVSKKSTCHFSGASADGVDEGGMKLLASVATIENFKNEKLPISEASEKCPSQREGILEVSSIGCSVDAARSCAASKSQENNATHINDSKDLAVSMDIQRFTATEKAAENVQKVGACSSQNDAAEPLQTQSTVESGETKHPSETSTISHCKSAKKKDGHTIFEVSTEQSHALQEKPTTEATQEAALEMAETAASASVKRVDLTENNSKYMEQQQPAETSEKGNTAEGNNMPVGENPLKCDLKENTTVDQKKLEGPRAESDSADQNAQAIQAVGSKELIQDGAENTISQDDAETEKTDRGKFDDSSNDLKQSKEEHQMIAATEETAGKPATNMDVDGVHRGVDDVSTGTEETVKEQGQDVQMDDGKAVNNEVNHEPSRPSNGNSETQSVADLELNKSGGCQAQEDAKDEQAHMNQLSAEQEEKNTSTSTAFPQPTLDPEERTAAGEELLVETAPEKNNALSNDTSLRLDIDLNEGPSVDESNQDDVVSSPTTGASENASASTGLATPIAVAVKRPLLPVTSSLRSSGEPGWKGIAPTSAFRPAEPRKTPEKQPVIATENFISNNANSGAASCSTSQGRPPLNIDLNVPDEGVDDNPLLNGISARLTSSELASVSGHNPVHSTKDASATTRNGSTSTGKLDFDLNRADEIEDACEISPYKEETQSSKRLVNGLSNGGESSQAAAAAPRNFDLNDGPCLEDAVVVDNSSWSSSSRGKGSSYLPSMSSWNMNGQLLNVSTWLPPGTSHLGHPIHSIAPDRVVDRTYPAVVPASVAAAAAAAPHILSSSSSASAYSIDSYRGPVLTSNIGSSIASTIAYPNVSHAAFPYGNFSFGSHFPLPSTSYSGGPTSFRDSMGACYPATQLVSTGSVSSAAGRPFIMDVNEMSASESSCKWSRPILDLNAGPGIADAEARESSKQSSISENWVSSEEQARLLGHVGPSGVLPLKRKEPEGGWDARSVGFPQPSPWQ